MCRMASPQRDPRTGVYFIRIAIPEALKGYFKEHHGRAHEWKKQLVDPDTGEKARSPSDAKRLWPDYYGEWTVAKETAENAVKGSDVRLTMRQRQMLAEDWLQDCLNDHEALFQIDEDEDFPDIDHPLYDDGSVRGRQWLFGSLEFFEFFQEHSAGRGIRDALEVYPVIQREVIRLLERHKIRMLRTTRSFQVIRRRVGRSLP